MFESGSSSANLDNCAFLENQEDRDEFKERALSFHDAYAKKSNCFKTIVRSGKAIDVGVGEYEGLIIGKADLVTLRMAMDMLHDLFENKEIVPQTYRLKELYDCRFPDNNGVQEFIDRPTLNDLINFLKGGIHSELINQQAISRCQEFLDAVGNKGIDLKKLNEADQELYEHSTSLPRRTIFTERNVLVLGMDPEGRVILAPVDVE